MPVRRVPTWQSKLTESFRKDPKKAGILGVLTLVLIVMGGRMMLSGKTQPASADAMNVVTAPTPLDADQGFKAPGKKDTSVAMQRWLAASTAKISRNLFAVKLEFYPQPSGKSPISPNNHPQDEDKSAEQASDEWKDRQSRIEALQLQARQLKLQSTLMSARPQAMINGQVVKEGDLITSNTGESQATFKVLKIEPRRIIVQHEGVRLEILMAN